MCQILDLNCGPRVPQSRQRPKPLKMGLPRPLLLFIFGLLKQTLLFYNNTMWWPSTIQCQDLNPRLLGRESPPITTRLRLPPEPMYTFKNQNGQTYKISKSVIIRKNRFQKWQKFDNFNLDFFKIITLGIFLLIFQEKSFVAKTVWKNLKNDSGNDDIDGGLIKNLRNSFLCAAIDAQWLSFLANMSSLFGKRFWYFQRSTMCSTFWSSKWRNRKLNFHRFDENQSR